LQFGFESSQCGLWPELRSWSRRRLAGVAQILFVLHQHRICWLLVLSCLFVSLCRLGLNPNPSMSMFLTVLVPVTKPVLSFSSSLSSLVL
jgi:hypothetical protein